MKKLFSLSLFIVLLKLVVAQPIITGAEQTDLYIHQLKNKRIALVVNQTSAIGAIHLVDSLLKLHVNIVKVFAPEHGFRGSADAGEHVANERDATTGVNIISLYGNHKKPTKTDLQNVDVLIFDIQDVGARFYTYISTLHYVMQAAAENNKLLYVFDRPNPNGHYVDGPMLSPKYKSFVGMHKVPVVHGMTIGEYALMLNTENWLSENTKQVKCKLKIIPCKNYTHHTFYTLPIKPSPNLPNMTSIYLYPSLCFFEGTVISLGRGTDKPFQQFGHPSLSTFYDDTFTPISKTGAKNPPCLNEKCFGKDLSQIPLTELQHLAKVDISYLVEAYKQFADKQKFFISFFSSLAGSEQLQKQIEDGLTAQQISDSWKVDVEKFKQLRKKYLLYDL